MVPLNGHQKAAASGIPGPEGLRPALPDGNLIDKIFNWIEKIILTLEIISGYSSGCAEPDTSLRVESFD